MAFILLGLILWSGIHLIPALAPAVKLKWKAALGNIGYQASFALLIVGSIVLMVVGWQQAIPSYLYTLPESIRMVSIGMIAVATVLFVAAKIPSRIKRFLRHPQLSGLALWSSAHLLANGDSRSALLFSGLLIWSILEILFINRREGAWVKPNAPGLINDILVLGIGGGLFILLIAVHPYLSGIPLY